MGQIDPVLAARYRALALASLSPSLPFNEVPHRLLVVDVTRQRLGLLAHGRLLSEYVLSTALNGLGCEEGSYRTPTGWHRIHAKIGAGAPQGAIFRGRVATGEIWQGAEREDDLILTRILTLEGLEEGVNRGPGLDSLERTIYLHGTNRHADLGRPLSHGCLRLSNADVIELFDQVDEGTPLVIAEPQTALEGRLGLGRLHFAGLAGSGMSALAQFTAMLGGRASGSDRAFDLGQQYNRQAQLERLGISVHPQDGSGVRGDCAALVTSTAVEDEVADVREARRLGVPVLHRSELLGHFAASRHTLAITGTSGKSTTVAMTFELLRGAGLDPSVITGGDLLALQREGLWGNAWAGGSDLLVIEADESDGSLVRYHPALGLVLNLQKDHKEEAVVMEMFQTFRAQVTGAFLVGAAENLAGLRGGALTFGLDPAAHVHPEALQEDALGSSFRLEDQPFRLNVPGRHNLENALAALAACRVLGVPLLDLVEPLARYQGVARRFQVLGETRGITVVDDFAHNPAKVRASLQAAHLRAKRILAVFQPHGYGPMRFLWDDFVAAFSEALNPEDRLWMLEVFYAGGTAKRDFSAADVVSDISARNTRAQFAPSREGLIEALRAEAREGDLILVMGARDPSLSDFAKRILVQMASCPW